MPAEHVALRDVHDGALRGQTKDPAAIDVPRYGRTSRTPVQKAPSVFTLAVRSHYKCDNGFNILALAAFGFRIGKCVLQKMLSTDI